MSPVPRSIYNEGRMSWFKRPNSNLQPDDDGEANGDSNQDFGAESTFAPVSDDGSPARVRTEGLWVKCPGCRQILFKAELEANLQVCPKCGHHFKIGARQRIDMLLEPGYTLVDGNLRSTDPLNFTDIKTYKSRLAAAQKQTGLNDAIITALGALGSHQIVLCAMEYTFIGGSMGAVVGELIARAIDRSLSTRHPLVIVTASGGARMMEGVVSLMQLAKIATGLAQLDEARIPYACVLTDPTTGGITASFAMLGDLNIAEPGALIGFAGPRVIEQTIRQKLPEGFQRSEFLLEHGFLDAVVPRSELKSYLIRALDFMKN
jgi:acetyl-CoA carboxylase carboxyl transferase subunit beta